MLGFCAPLSIYPVHSPIPSQLTHYSISPSNIGNKGSVQHELTHRDPNSFSPGHRPSGSTGESHSSNDADPVHPRFQRRYHIHQPPMTSTGTEFRRDVQSFPSSNISGLRNPPPNLSRESAEHLAGSLGKFRLADPPPKRYININF